MKGLQHMFSTHADFAGDFNTFMKAKESIQTLFCLFENRVVSTAQAFIVAPPWWSLMVGSALVCVSMCTRVKISVKLVPCEN